jgi:hypothetical protein
MLALDVLELLPSKEQLILIPCSDFRGFGIGFRRLLLRDNPTGLRTVLFFDKIFLFLSMSSKHKRLLNYLKQKKRFLNQKPIQPFD